MNPLCHVREIELSYKSKNKPADTPVVRSSGDAYKLFYESWEKQKIELQEQFRVMLLDRKNGCIGIATVATGGISGCFVDLKIVFAMALKGLASSIILAHNHPSGNKRMSEEDKRLTERFAAAGKLLDMPVRDHLIVTTDGYASFADEGLL